MSLLIVVISDEFIYIFIYLLTCLFMCFSEGVGRHACLCIDVFNLKSYLSTLVLEYVLHTHHRILGSVIVEYLLIVLLHLTRYAVL